MLVQVQMQVLVMLPPQVLLRCYSVKVLGAAAGNTHEAKLHFLWILSQ